MTGAEQLHKILTRYAAKQDGKTQTGYMVYCQDDKRYQGLLQYMERLAFLGMQAKQIILPATLMHQAHTPRMQQDINEQSKMWEILKEIGIVKRYNDARQAEFAHLTFQEFFAARYLAQSMIAAWGPQTPATPSGDKLDIDALSAFIAQTKFDAFYSVMWWFVAGLLTQSSPNQKPPTVFQCFVDALLQDPRTELDLQELTLLLRCLEETQGAPIAQQGLIIANTQRWCEFYLTANYDLAGTLLDKFWQTVLVCLKLAEQLADYWQARLPALLAQGDYYSRPRAFSAISGLGRALPPLLNLLYPLLSHPDKDVRTSVAETIGQLGAQASLALQAGLKALLIDENWQVRQKAAAAVSQCGADASPILQTDLLPLLADENKYVRYSAATAVGALGAHTTLALQTALLPLLTDKYWHVRGRAATAVGTLSAHASPALQTAFLPLLADENAYVRQSAATAVGALGAHAIPALQAAFLPLLADENWTVRASAVTAMGALGAYASPALQSALLPLLADKEAWVRERAATAVGRLGAHATPAVQTGLLSLLADKNKDVRASAAQAVGLLGPHATPALQAKLKVLMRPEEDRWVRKQATQALALLPTTFGYFCQELYKGRLPEKLRPSAGEGLAARSLRDTLVESAQRVKYSECLPGQESSRELGKTEEGDLLSQRAKQGAGIEAKEEASLSGLGFDVSDSKALTSTRPIIIKQIIHSGARAGDLDVRLGNIAIRQEPKPGPS